MAIHVPLTNGYFAIIDDDQEHLLNWRWHTKVSSDRLLYAARNEVSDDGKRRTVRMHRLIMGVTDSRLFVDHINGDGLDNRKKNLRLCSNAENLRNQHRARSDNVSTGVLGVSKTKSGFRARLMLEGKHIYLGTYKTLDEAAQARSDGERMYFGKIK